MSNIHTERLSLRSWPHEAGGIVQDAQIATTYNAAGLQVESVYSTESEVILYKWTYTYR